MLGVGGGYSVRDERMLELCTQEIIMNHLVSHSTSINKNSLKFKLNRECLA